MTGPTREDEWETPVETARFVYRKPATIHDWIRRGLIRTRKGLRGETLCHLGDAWELTLERGRRNRG